MSIINRYILRQFVLNFLILIVVVQVLFVSIDLVVNLEYYINAAKAIHKREEVAVVFAFVRVVVDFYVPMCMMMYVYMSGIVVVAAMGFTVTALQRTRELTAVVASGVSLRRVAMVLAVAGFGLNLLAAPVQEWALPPLAYNALRSRRDLVHEGGAARDPIRLMPVNRRGDLLSADSFDMKAGHLKGFHLMERDDDGRCVRDITGDEARWDGAAGAWVFHPAARAVAPATGGLDVPVEQTQKNWPTVMSPKVIHACQDGAFARLLSLGDMRALAGIPTIAPEFRDSLRQAWWVRLFMPVFNTLLILAAMPFFLSRLPGMTPKRGILAAVTCLGCWGGGVLVMSSAFLPPFWAACLPVVLLAGLGVRQILRIET